MKIITWNVNGIRVAMKNGFMKFFEEHKPDILCIQETKAQQEQIQINFNGYKQYWNSAKKKGYSGTAVFTKLPALSVQYGMGIKEHDNEGRILALEYKDFFLVNVYTPNSQRELTRLDYRMKWEKDFKVFLKNLEKTKPVIVCGDLNVAHNEIDIARPQNNKTTKSRPGNAGFTDQEREKMTKLLNSGFVDVFRHFYPEKEEVYTWWSYMFSARQKNIGWRLDYFLASENLMKKIKDIEILKDVMGSDHCPVLLALK